MSLTFVYSSMNSGKSLSLLTKHHMLTNRGYSVILAKPEVDTRSEGTISTRLGLSQPCLLIKEELSTQILKSGNKKPDFCLIDEAQFLTKEQVWELANLSDNWDIEIICYDLS